MTLYLSNNYSWLHPHYYVFIWKRINYAKDKPSAHTILQF